MAINKKLITFAKKDVFLGQYGINHAENATNGYFGNIPAHSIVFIKDTGEIWQGGKYYGSIDAQTTAGDSNDDCGIVFKHTDGKYYRRPLTLWGNRVDGDPAYANGDLKVGNLIQYGSEGIGKITNTVPEMILRFRDLKDVVIPSGKLELNGGDFTINKSGIQKFKVEQTTGNVEASGSIIGSKVLNTPTYIAESVTKGGTWVSIQQYSVSGQTVQTNSLANNPPAYLTIQEGQHSSDYNWKPWIADADLTSKSSWGIGLSGDAFYIGRVAVNQSTNALTNSWIFDNEGYITSAGYKKKNSSDSYVLLGGGGHKLETALSVGSAAKLTTPVTITIGSQSQNFDGSSNISFNLSDITSGASWDLTYSPTSVQFAGDWVRMPLDFSSFVSGTYLLTIEDSAAYYTGVFMFSTGTINTDEEILLHACGTRAIYGSGNNAKQGILYAKIKPYNNNAALWLAYSHQVTKSGISIKIKKLATL